MFNKELIFNKKTFLLFFLLFFLSGCSNQNSFPRNSKPNLEKDDDFQLIEERVKLKEYQEIYTSKNLGIRFVYAKKDPLYNQNCEISEKNNTIYNSCGYSVEIVKKDPNLSNLEVVNNIIETENQNYCKISEKYDDNLKDTYQILPNYDKIPSNLNNIFDICGKYTSHYLSNQYKFCFDSGHLDHFMVIEYGGHEPQGVLDILDNGSLKYWFETIEFINNN
ncbi:MAG TPA: hypothetical protein PK142_02860 [bacterium]|nr:hypothetical protein [bacterium]